MIKTSIPSHWPRGIMPPPELVASDLSLFTPELEIPYPETPKEFAQLKAISRHLRTVFSERLELLYPKEIEQHREPYELLKTQKYCFSMAVYNARNMYHLVKSNEYIAANKPNYITMYLDEPELFTNHNGWVINPSFIPKIKRPSSPVFNWKKLTEEARDSEVLKMKGSNKVQPDAKGSYNKTMSFDKFEWLRSKMKLKSSTVLELSGEMAISKDSVSKMLNHKSCANHWAVHCALGMPWFLPDLTGSQGINKKVDNLVVMYMKLHRKQYPHLSESMHKQEEKSITVGIRKVRLKYVDKDMLSSNLHQPYKELWKLYQPLYKRETSSRLAKLVKSGEVHKQYPQHIEAIEAFIKKHPQLKKHK